MVDSECSGVNGNICTAVVGDSNEGGTISTCPRDTGIHFQNNKIQEFKHDHGAVVWNGRGEGSWGYREFRGKDFTTDDGPWNSQAFTQYSSTGLGIQIKQNMIGEVHENWWMIPRYTPVDTLLFLGIALIVILGFIIKIGQLKRLLTHRVQMAITPIREYEENDEDIAGGFDSIYLDSNGLRHPHAYNQTCGPECPRELRTGIPRMLHLLGGAGSQGQVVPPPSPPAENKPIRSRRVKG